MHVWVKVSLSLSLSLTATIWAWKVLPEYRAASRTSWLQRLAA